MSSARSRLYSFFSAIPNPISCLRNSRVASISASILIVGLEQILDFIFTQEMEKDHVDWGYFTEAPSRIVGFTALSLLLGYSLENVIRTIQQDQEENVTNISPKAVLVSSTAYTTSMWFTRLALTTPITLSNAGYVIGSSLMNGALYGTFIAQMGYTLQRLNYTIRPLSKNYIPSISAGIAFALLQELLDYMCTQMTEKNQLDWDSLTTPRRLLAWHAIYSTMQGIFYGVIMISLKKYSQITGGDEDRNQTLRRVKNIFLIVTSIATFVPNFTYHSLMTPINATNAFYVFSGSLFKSVPLGLASGASGFLVTRLKFFPETERVTDSSINTPFLRAEDLLPPPTREEEQQNQVSLS